MKFLTLKNILLLFLGTFVVLQFFGIDKTNPPVNQQLDFIQINQPSAEIATMLKSACYDCHSNETNYPWYSNVAPVSWWVKGHIDHGREELNFSKWGTYKTGDANHMLEECAEEVEKKEMPITPYLLTHSEARLSEKERATLAAFFKSKVN